jgi:hypothetical protein
MKRTLMGKSALVALALLLLGAGTVFGQSKKNDTQNVRSVQGVVSDAKDNPAVGAVVQLKNTKNLQVRSFITKDKGEYFFNSLSTDVDYELRAEFNGASSGPKTLSSFDSRKQSVINLKLKN